MDTDTSNIKLLSILSKGWQYRGEGNANIVLSLPKLHQILRIKKTDKPTTILGWFFHWLVQIFQWDSKKDLEYEMKNLQFYNKVMIPLLGQIYVHPATSIHTCRRDIQRLDKELMPFRPAHRRHKHLQCGMATLFIDYAFLSKEWNCNDLTGATYAVEIKPKQGWIPLAARNFDRCQFCLNQYLKLQNCQIKEVSSYCPLDLFSGEKERMLQALKSLIFNPQNNLRIFKDGIFTYGENTSVQTYYDLLHLWFEETDSINNLTRDFCELILQALLKDFYKNDGCVNCDDSSRMLPQHDTYINELENNKCGFNNSQLPPGTVLERILSLQKLNRLGLNKYYDVHEALIRNKTKFDDWSYVEKLLQDSFNKCPKCVIVELARNTEKRFKNGEVLSDLDLVPYLLAAVANDCSFMVTFRKIYNITQVPDDFIVTVRNTSFLVNIGIFDLYPKPVSTIAKHVRRNLKVQKAYASKNPNQM